MTVPRSLGSGLLTLIAVKGTAIKLASTLGTLEQLLSAAGPAGTVTSSNLSSATVTHLTTANFALADSDHDGMVSQAELAAYVPDFSAIQKAATIIQAYIDGGQSSLIGGSTSDTLALALAAVQNKSLGMTGQTADDWFDDPVNAQAIATAKEALNTALARELEGKLSSYRLTETVTQQTIPEKVYANGGAASIYCGTDRTIGVPVAFDDVAVAFDAARGITLVRYTGDDEKFAYILGAYNPQTGAVSLLEMVPKYVVQPGEVTFYQDKSNKYDGSVDAAGSIAGTFVSKSATTWSLDATRQECTDSGTFTMTKR